jgi:NADH-quinone oxidoreductase subunit C
MGIVEKTIDFLQEEFEEEVISVSIFRDQTTLEVSSDGLQSIVMALRDHPEFQYNHLADITAVDYWPDEPRFAVVYQLYSISNREFLTLKVRLASDKAEVPSIEEIFKNANWHEREVLDMFGIEFFGHSDPRRIIMPHDWEGHPLRKDYPLGYEEVQFSFNFDEIDKRKPYAVE